MSRHVTLLVVALTAGGCGMFNDAPYLIDELSVVAVVAEPPEIHADETALLTAWVVDPQNPDGPVTTSWSCVGSICGANELTCNARLRRSLHRSGVDGNPPRAGHRRRRP